jgi:3-hydroxyacyl-CoA dehydrogenase
MIARVAVIRAGAMGGGIDKVAAVAGCEVRFADLDAWSGWTCG